MYDAQAAKFLVPNLPRSPSVISLFVHLDGSGANQAHPPDVIAQQASIRSFEEDKVRFLVLHYVKTSTVLGFQPLDWMEHAERRLSMDLMNDAHFRAEMLQATRVRIFLPQYPMRVVVSIC